MDGCPNPTTIIFAQLVWSLWTINLNDISNPGPQTGIVGMSGNFDPLIGLYPKEH